MRNHHTTFESDELLLTLRTVLPLYKDVENPQVIMWIWDIECARWCYVMGYESECGPDLIMSLVYNESCDYYEMGDVCENEFDNRHYIYGIYPSGSRPKVNTIIKHLRKLKHGTPVVG